MLWNIQSAHYLNYRSGDTESSNHTHNPTIPIRYENVSLATIFICPSCHEEWGIILNDLKSI
jgi:hypothetical protein